REALRAGLADGTIDAVATDHAPHAVEDKEQEFDHAAPGTIGLETALAVVLTELVRPGLLPLSRALEAMSTSPSRILAAEDPGGAVEEAVFNTAMSGYQDVLTDPSYAGQIVTMTYPHQGNYGVNGEDPESAGIQVAGFAVREASRRPSSWRSERSLPEELEGA